MREENRDFEETLKGSDVLLLDGAVGTMLMDRGEAACERLNLTNPEVVAELHRSYVAAGADMITTNTTCANGIMCRAEEAAAMARRGAEIAAGVARECRTRRVWVAGSMGPTAVSLARQPGLAAEMVECFADQAVALVTGGADLLLVETCFDLQNAVAAMRGIAEAERLTGRRVPVVVSGTVANADGRLASGETLGQLYETVSREGGVAAFGLNCSFGVENGLDGLVGRLADSVSVPLVVYPSAGVPGAAGRHDATPEEFAETMCRVVRRHGVKVAGGCCGTTPAHIAMLGDRLRNGDRGLANV